MENLIEYCRSGDLEGVKSLMEGGSSINLMQRDCNGRTPLLIACLMLHFDIVEYLLNIKWMTKKIFEDTCTHTGMNILHMACFSSKDDDDDDDNNDSKIVQLILNSKWMTPEFFCSRDKSGNTPIMYSASIANHLKSFKILLSSIHMKKNVLEIQDLNGDTVLHNSCEYGRYKIVQLLLSSNLMSRKLINQKNKNGTTPVEYACDEFSNFETAKLILSDDRLNENSLCFGDKQNKWSILRITVYTGDIDLFEFILNHKHFKPEILLGIDSNGNTLLHHLVDDYYSYPSVYITMYRFTEYILKSKYRYTITKMLFAENHKGISPLTEIKLREGIIDKYHSAYGIHYRRKNENGKMYELMMDYIKMVNELPSIKLNYMEKVNISEGLNPENRKKRKIIEFLISVNAPYVDYLGIADYLPTADHL